MSEQPTMVPVPPGGMVLVFEAHAEGEVTKAADIAAAAEIKE